MNASFVALTVICAIIGAGSFIAFYAGRRYKMDLEQWTVGNRGFGMLLVWLLMAGETYTTFTFLGASRRAYSWGGPVLYILAYQPLIFVVPSNRMNHSNEVSVPPENLEMSNVVSTENSV